MYSIQNIIYCKHCGKKTSKPVFCCERCSRAWHNMMIHNRKKNIDDQLKHCNICKRFCPLRKLNDIGPCQFFSDVPIFDIHIYVEMLQLSI